MKQTIALMIALLILVSCASVKKDIQKTTTTDNSKEKIVDKSTTETTKIIDTSITTKADSAKAVLQPADWDDAFAIGNDSIVENITTSGSLTVTASYNKNTKQFTATAKKGPEKINVKLNETTKKQNDITTTKENDVETKEVVKAIERESNMNWTKVCIWLGVVLILIAFFVYSLKTYLKK